MDAAAAATPAETPAPASSHRERAADVHRLAALAAIEAMHVALTHLDFALRFEPHDDRVFREPSFAMGRALEAFDVEVRAFRAVRDCQGEG
jgi:hypothetical protein